jgi:UDP-glucose 4-epimerase
MARWLVTGGCGFIGSHLVEALLKRGDRVRILDDLSNARRHPEIEGAELLIGDVADRKIVLDAMTGVEGCFHLAAVASVQRCTEDWLGTHRSNLTGTITVFDAARRINPMAPLPVVYASSAAVYGANPHMPLAETAATHPLSSYGADKLGCELHAQIAWPVHRIPNLGLRFFNVYGPRQDPRSPYSGVISVFVDKTVNHRTIDIFGDGTQVRDFIYVADIVAYLLAAMADLRSGARIFNLCTGRATSVIELANIIGEIVGRRSRIEYHPARVGDIRVSLGDPTAATKAFGFAAATSIRDGLRRTLDFMSEHVCDTVGSGNHD